MSTGEMSQPAPLTGQSEVTLDTSTGATTEALSALSRNLTFVVAGLFTLLGLVLFFVPDWASANFLWKVSPFVAMTMGGWYLGSAFLAWEVARVWRWSSVYASIIFLWVFSLLETVVLLVHSN